LSVGKAIGKALGIEPTPYIRIGHGRITVTFASVPLTTMHIVDKRPVIV